MKMFSVTLAYLIDPHSCIHLVTGASTKNITHILIPKTTPLEFIGEVVNLDVFNILKC